MFSQLNINGKKSTKKGPYIVVYIKFCIFKYDYIYTYITYVYVCLSKTSTVVYYYREETFVNQPHTQNHKAHKL